MLGVVGKLTYTEWFLMFSGSQRDDDEDDDAAGQLCLACLIQILHMSMCRVDFSKRCMHVKSSTTRLACACRLHSLEGKRALLICV